MRERPELNSTSLRESTSRTLLPIVASSAGFMAILSLALEVGTGQYLSKAVDSPVFLSTPLGLAAAFITLLALRESRKASMVPAVMVALYWVGFFVFL